MPRGSDGQDNPNQPPGGSDKRKNPRQTDVTRRAFDLQDLSGSFSVQGSDKPSSLNWEKPKTPQDFQRRRTRPRAQTDQPGSRGGPASEDASLKGPLQRLRDARSNVSSSGGPEQRQVISPTSSSDGPTMASSSDSGVFSASDGSAPLFLDRRGTDGRTQGNRHGDNTRASKRQRLVENSLPPRAVRERDYAERLQEALAPLIQEQNKEVMEQLTQHTPEESRQPDSIDILGAHMRENRELQERHLSARETKEREHLTRYQQSERAPDSQGSETEEFHDMKWKHLEQYYNLERSLLEGKYARLETRLNVGNSSEREHFTTLMREHNKKEYGLLTDQLIERQNQEKIHLEQRQGKNQDGMPALAFRQIHEREELAYKQLDQRKALELDFQKERHQADLLFRPNTLDQIKLHKEDEAGLLQYYEMKREKLKFSYDKEKGREKLKKYRELEEQQLSDRETLEKDQLLVEQQFGPSQGKETSEKHAMEREHLEQRYKLERSLLESKYERLEPILKVQNPRKREHFTELMREYNEEEDKLLKGQLEERQRQEKEHLKERSINEDYRESTKDFLTTIAIRQIEEKGELAQTQLHARKELKLRLQERRHELDRQFHPHTPGLEQCHEMEKKRLHEYYQIEKEYIEEKCDVEKEFRTRGDISAKSERVKILNDYMNNKYDKKKSNFESAKSLDDKMVVNSLLLNSDERKERYAEMEQKLEKDLKKLKSKYEKKLKDINTKLPTQRKNLDNEYAQTRRERTPESGRISLEEIQIRERQRIDEESIVAKISQEKKQLDILHREKRLYDPNEPEQAERHQMELTHVSERHIVLAQTQQRIYDTEIANLKLEPSPMREQLKEIYMEYAQRESALLQAQLKARHTLEVQQSNDANQANEGYYIQRYMDMYDNQMHEQVRLYSDHRQRIQDIKDQERTSARADERNTGSPPDADIG